MNKNYDLLRSKDIIAILDLVLINSFKIIEILL